MKKKKPFVFGIILIVVALIIGFIVSVKIMLRDSQSDTKENFETNDTASEEEKTSPSNATYIIEGNEFDLRNGTALKHNALNSAVSEKVTLRDESTPADFNADSRDDSIVILTHEPGGTGTFYYVAAAFQKENSYTTSNSIFLGDRIIVSDINVNASGFAVNYLDRRPDQDFSTQPTIAKTARFAIDSSAMTITKAPEISIEPTTNADKLLGAAWKWIKTDIAKQNIRPDKPDVFAITFNADGSFNVRTDCNSVGGTYTASHSLLDFGQMYSTLMYCENSYEAEFTKTLDKVETYRLESPNYLVLEFFGGEIHLTR